MGCGFLRLPKITIPETISSPLQNRRGPKRKQSYVIPSIFRCYVMLVLGRVPCNFYSEVIGFHGILDVVSLGFQDLSVSITILYLIPCPGHTSNVDRNKKTNAALTTPMGALSILQICGLPFINLGCIPQGLTWKMMIENHDF